MTAQGKPTVRQRIVAETPKPKHKGGKFSAMAIFAHSCETPCARCYYNGMADQKRSEYPPSSHSKPPKIVLDDVAWDRVWETRLGITWTLGRWSGYSGRGPIRRAVERELRRTEKKGE